MILSHADRIVAIIADFAARQNSEGFIRCSVVTKGNPKTVKIARKEKVA